MAEDTGSISAEAVGRNLRSRFIGRRLVYYPSVPSTMDLAREEARGGAVEGSAVVAGEQTYGRGRRGRIWMSPPGSISVSLVVRPQHGDMVSLVMVAALAVANAIEMATGLRAGIKWPNDVLINRRKVCGILIENELGRDFLSYAVVGIGINVNLRTGDYPEIASLATSLSDELGRTVSCLDLLCRLFEEFERLYLAASAGSGVFEQWRARLVTLGRRVVASCEGTSLEGVAESVASDGSLILRHPDGTSSKVVAGDVSLRDD